MGWTGYPRDRRPAVDIVREEISSGGYNTIIANSGAKNWVIENKHGRMALVVLTKRHNGDLYTKVVSEDMGPYDYTFPLKLLNLLGEPLNEYSAEWREKVREHHASKKAAPSVSPGDVVEFDTPINFTRGYQFDRLTYLGGYRFRGATATNTIVVTMPKTWRTRYSWRVVS